MKKFILAAVVLVGMSVQAFAGPIVTIKIRIGKNKEACAAFGLCWNDSDVTVSGALVANGTEGGTTLQLNDINGNLEITIPSTVWKEKANYFSASYVTFEEEINFGSKISSMLKSSVPVLVRPGKYALKKDSNGNVIIIIPQEFTNVSK